MDMLKRCLDSDTILNIGAIQDVLYVVLINFSFVDLLNSWIVLYLKSNSDVVVSFSKLDNLIAISSF